MHVADRRGSASYSPDLVVAVEHAREVRKALEQLGVRVGAVEESQDLGLSLVPLADGAPERDDLDGLLQRLRGHFADEYTGWVPTIGKNRLLGDVLGGGKISHGGALAPAHAEDQLPRRDSRDGAGVRVGVLDTAIASHPWLAGGWVAAADDVLPPDEAAYPAVVGHATFIAGLVLQQAPGCVVVARQVLAPDGSADSWTVAREIVAHGQQGLDVLNLSLFCHTEDGEAPLVLARAIERLPSETVVVAAAGNHGEDGGPVDPSRPAWPAALDGVIAVGATKADGRVASFSPQGVPWVDAVAPGENCVSTYLTGTVTFKGDVTDTFEGLATWSGTSFAAASVSGAIAAATRPGQVSARQAWEGMRGDERPFTLG